MRRSDFYIKLLTTVLFLAVASYIGVYIYNAARTNVVTMTAISYSVEETAHTEGYAVRQETVVSGGGGALPVVSDGVKVAAGQSVAIEYRSGAAIETAAEIRALKLKIAQLEEAEKNADIVALGFESVLQLSRAVNDGSLAELDELSIKVDSYIFSDGNAPGDELPELRARLNNLERGNFGADAVYAPVSGVFSSVVDGFEHVDPDMLSSLKPSGLRQLFDTPVSTGGAGKLITGIRWYFASIMDSADAARLAVGGDILVQFTGTFRAAVTMRVESVVRDENGNSAVVFSCDRNIPQAAPLRALQAEVVFDTVTGIRVPKEAIHLDDDCVTFVYLRSGALFERANVEILLESGDSYLVRDGRETGTGLRAGASIVVRADNIEDGKVIR